MSSSQHSPTTAHRINKKPSFVSDAKKRDSSSSSSVETVLGLGSLLSERSARTTFPNLRKFRLGRVPNHRRVFGHTPHIFHDRGIADWDTLEMSSLCAEYHPGASFVCSVFDIDPEEEEGEGEESSSGKSFREHFLEREEEFEIEIVEYQDFGEVKEGEVVDTTNTEATGSMGILCLKSTDDAYIERWGKDRYTAKYTRKGINTIWGWNEDSGLKPCAPYLRHCVLAAERMGDACFASFLDETFLVDRTTTIRDYLEKNPHVMKTNPPPELAERYGG